MTFHVHRLANGLEIIAECNPDAYSSAYGFFVRTGSRDETDELSGVSHFLEHMAFNGTAKRSADDVNRRLDELGANANAYTSEEKTVYYAAVLPEYQSDMVELLADIMRPALREEDFVTEKKVILEEIFKYEDQPPFGAHEKCMAAYFGRHPLGRTILGTNESVSRLTPEMMRQYFERRYCPGNMVLVGAGRVDWERLIADAESLCGHWPIGDTSRLTPPADANYGTQLLRKPDATQEYVIQISPGPATEDEDRYAARILATCVGDDSGSRFFWELTDKGLVEYAGLSTYEFQGTGIYMGYLCCAPEDTASNLEIVRRIYDEVERSGVLASEVELAKSKINSHIVLRAERPLNRMFAVGSSWIQRHEYQTLQDVVIAYDRVTLDDVHTVLAKYPLSRHNTFAVGPLEQL